jgi:hypothetical protein
MLLVLCPDPAVATWSARPIVVTSPGLRLTPVVLGPQQVPPVTDIAVARRHPELTLLSALAHGDGKDPGVFAALFAALEVIDRDHAKLSLDLLVTALPAATRRWLEEMMTTAPHRIEYQSDFARRYVREGVAKGKAEALLTVLDARDIPVPDEVRAEITACTDVDKLATWIRRAAAAERIEDVLD